MGGSGFAGGLFEGFQLAQDRAIQAQQLKLQKQMIDAQTKYMETQDQMHQVNLQNLMRQVNARQALPGLRQQIFTQPAPVPIGNVPVEGLDQPVGVEEGTTPISPQEASAQLTSRFTGDMRSPLQAAGDMGVTAPRLEAEQAKGRPVQSGVYAPEQVPMQQIPAPELDRTKLASFLQTAADAGQDPMQVLNLMAVADPRIRAIQDSLMPKKYEKVGEGESLVNPQTGQTIATGPAKQHVVPAGGTLTGGTGAPFTAPPKPPDFGDHMELVASAYLKNTYGIENGTMAQLIKIDPVKAAAIEKEIGYERPLDIATAKADATLERQQKQLLTPEEAHTLAVPYGTTKGQAKGILPLSTVQREAIAAFDTARIIIDDIDQYSKKVNIAPGGIVGRGQQAAKLWGAYTQSDPDAAMLQSKAGELARLARSMGEKGAMAEGDIARAQALIPGVTDTKEIALRKVTDLKALIDNNENAFRASVGMKPRSQTSGTKTPSPKKLQQQEPPEAQIPVPKNLTPKQQEIYRQEYLKQRQKVQKEMQKGTTNAAKPQR